MRSSPSVQKYAQAPTEVRPHRKGPLWISRATVDSKIKGEEWPAPGAHATRLVQTVHELSNVPLTNLTIEDIRILLSQSVGVGALPRGIGIPRFR